MARERKRLGPKLIQFYLWLGLMKRKGSDRDRLRKRK